jgi:hypothetical protein
VPVFDQDQGEKTCVISPEREPEPRPTTRRSLLTQVPRLPLRLPLLSAALFAGIAARGTPSAFAHPGQGSPGCCTLAKPDVWCQHVGPLPGDFSCDHGTNPKKRVWYCCQAGSTLFWGCGECQSGTGTCFGGPIWFCSFAWVENAHFC